MKNLFFLFLATFLSISLANAQDASKQFKSASKEMGNYADDPVANSADLTAAIANLKSALESGDVNTNAKNWITAGKAYNKIANAEFKAKTLDAAGTYKIAIPNSAIDAYNAFAKAIEVDPKKIKDVTYGLEEVENHLNNFAIFAYQEADYSTAFDNFSASIMAYDKLKEMGKDSRLDEGALLSDQYFFSAVSAYYSSRNEEAKPYLQKLYDDSTTEGFVYEALYNVYAEEDIEKALGFLQKGREMAPDNTGLLFAEINYYLKIGELDVLIGKLKTAIEKEPDNTSIYNTLGSVYDQLQQKEFKAGNQEKADEYFASAKDYYNQVLERDAGNFDATYSIGALYYNKAASYVDKLNELAADLSPAGMKAYDETKATMDGIFSEALPFFDKAEALNGNDRNTLIALKEIHARLDNLEKSNSYKERLDALNGGGE